MRFQPFDLFEKQLDKQQIWNTTPGSSEGLIGPLSQPSTRSRCRDCQPLRQVTERDEARSFIGGSRQGARLGESGLEEWNRFLSGIVGQVDVDSVGQ